MAEYGIEPIDLAVVNLYPFTSDPGIQLIDIGGPTMVRAAAKNHAFVGVVVDPADYEPVLAEITAEGSLTPATRRRLARTRSPRSRLRRCDRHLVRRIVRRGDDAPVLPPSMHLSLELAQPLRYGENPHQQGARYRRAVARAGGT